MIEALVPDLYVDDDYYSELAAEMDLLAEVPPEARAHERTRWQCLVPRWLPVASQDGRRSHGLAHQGSQGQ